jgi:uncharacterized protein YegL
MRRLPVYLLIDTSESMVGTAIEAVQAGLGTLMTALRKNPYALEMGAISIISFDRTAKKLVPLTEVYSFQLPNLDVAPGTALGAGIRLLDQSLSAELVKTTPEQKGDYKPLIFILTDGQPTDEWKAAAAQFKRNHKSATVYAIGCGDDIDFSILREVTDNTFAMTQMDTDAFAKLFVCISSSVQSASASIGTAGTQEGAQDLEKWAGDAVKKVEKVEKPKSKKKRQVFISGVCQKQKKPYLLRYKLNDSGKYVCSMAHKLSRPFSKEEAGSIESVSSDELQGLVDCPHCGNSGHGRCDCGAMMCLDLKNVETIRGMHVIRMKCPACGTEGMMSFGGSFKINQSAG